MHALDGLSPLVRTPGDSSACTDARSRLIVALVVLLAVVMSTRMWLPVIVLAGCMVWLVALRASLRCVLCRLAAPLGLAAIIATVRTFSTGVTPIASFDLGPFHLTATHEGAVEGSLIGCRVLAAVAVVLVLSLTTSAEAILAALHWVRMPKTWIEIASLMYRYLFVFFDEAGRVVAAQRVRLGYSRWRSGLHCLGSLAGGVVLRSLDQADRTYEAMQARGFDGSLPLPTLPAMHRRQVFLTTALVATVVVAYLLAERWPR